ncbi:hypothetical protein [Chryseobacterium oryctis]|uniref:Uncharacterized protein n=1 Tax=Chryseobacterium oryctis TaxID=2952618 RepID=A0ABT3HMQ4_9FLAO|nr:hypothetical protein [Chryseobacterium oryctis]MCW3161075.1 hypothetical protein [Chryseobacterium oryctis]
MKTWIYILIFMMTSSCFGSSQSQNLTWYKNSTISQIIDDPDHPEKFLRISIGISQQVFYVSKKDPNYSSLLEKLNLSYKKGKTYNIGIENNTNIIKQINDIK